MDPNNKIPDDLSSLEKWDKRIFDGFLILIAGIIIFFASFILGVLLNKSPIWTIGFAINLIGVPLGLLITVIGVVWLLISYVNKKNAARKLKNNPESTELIVKRLIEEGSDFDQQKIKSDYLKILESKNWKPSSETEKIWCYIVKNEWNELFSDKILSINLISHIIANNFILSVSNHGLRKIEEIRIDMHPFKEPFFIELRNKSSKHPENIILLLGLIGDDQTIEEINTFSTYVQSTIKTHTDVTTQYNYLKAIAYAYGLTKNPRAIEPLVKMLDYDVISDKSSWDRSPASVSVNSLISFGSPAAIPLIKTISDPKSKILQVQNAGSALITIGKQEKPNRKVIESIEQSIKLENNTEKQKFFRDIIQKIKEL